MRAFKSFLVPTLCFFSMVATSYVAQQVAGQSSGDAEFYRGYYLQHQKQDLKGAIEAYKKSASLGASDKVLSMVDKEMQSLQQELASSDFAQLMPADALGYIEIDNPGQHAEKICTLMGITGREFKAGTERSTIYMDGLSISSDFQISPALLREIKKFRGIGIAVTEVQERGELPFKGVAVIHPGKSDLVTGLLETGLQLVPANETIGGFATFKVNNELWVVKTERLIVLGTSRDHISNCLGRIATPGEKSLDSSAHFKSAKAANEGAAVFAYISPKAVVAKHGQMLDGEMAIARMVLDLDSMEHISAGLMATNKGIRTRVGVQYAEDHNSFGYGLIRTIPLTKKALKHIPSGSTAVIGLGLNPKMLLAAQATGNRHFSALDIGRELFANIEEVGVYVMPSMAIRAEGIPDVGIIIASSDIEKSDSLWNQLLSLPSKLKAPESPQVETVSINGTKAQQYTFPGNEIPPIVIARIGEEAMVAGTRVAVEAALSAHNSQATLVNDPRAAAFWNTKSEFTSKAAFMNVSRAIELAQMNGGDEEMRMVAKVLEEMAFTLVVNEEPAKFEVQADLVGLPNFEQVIKAAAKMQGSVRTRARPPRVYDESAADIQLPRPQDD